MTPIVMCATRVHVRRLMFLPAFAWHTTQSHRQASAAPGNIRTEARSTGLLTFWTFTAWQDGEALQRYLVTGAHGRVMHRAKLWFDDAEVARWHSDSAHADWSEVERQLTAVGRKIPVLAPSAAQRARASSGQSVD